MSYKSYEKDHVKPPDISISMIFPPIHAIESISTRVHQVQHEHGLTLGQRVVYFFACLANTAAMLTTTLVFVMAILLPCATYVGRYHIMLLVILGAAVIGVATLVSASLALAGLDTGTLSADRWDKETTQSRLI